MILRAILAAMLDIFRKPEDRGIDRGHAHHGWKVAICVGHSRPGDNGATSIGNVSEWDYNREVAELFRRELAERDIEGIVIDSYHGGSYGAAMRWVAKEIKRLGCDVAVELHFNAAGPTAHGFEYLRYYASTAGEKLASGFLNAHRRAFPEARNRGVKSIRSGDRGSMFLKLTHCPAIIAEPFFGSNEGEWEVYRNAKQKLAETYADGIRRYLS